MSSPSSSKTEQSLASVSANGKSQSESTISIGLAKLDMNDEQSVMVTTDESGSYSTNTESERPSYSPGLKYSPPFVRASRSQSQDPFKSSPAATRHHHGSLTPTGAKSSRIASIMTKDWRSGSGSSDDNYAGGSPSPQDRDAARKLTFGGDDRDAQFVEYDVIKPDDSQSIYPPACCVFVANLLQSECEENLQMAVTQIFRDYGPVFVKVRRDAKQMPFAFCQFTKPEHAQRAIKEGRGRLIKGRPCRCEKAKAHRLFFVERKYGPVCTPDEVRQLLQPYGSIEFCHPASDVERTTLGLNEGVIVQFLLYDDGQSAQSAFRNHEVWKLLAIANMTSPSRIIAPARGSQSDTARAYLSRYEVDRCSIFVGNLPLGINEVQVKGIFERYGKIDDIVLREGSSKFEPQDKFCFAFVQFEDVMAVSNILAVEDGFNFGGKILRISQKDSESGGSRRPATRTHPTAPTPAASYQAPAPAVPYQSPTAQAPQQQFSPIAPPGYGSPFAYAYGSAYGYYPNPAGVYPDAQNYYQPPAYPSYYAYSNPHYDPAAAMAASPAPQYTYNAYTYPGGSYQVAPTPYWGMGSPNAGPPSAAPTAAYYPPAYSPTVATGTDRSILVATSTESSPPVATSTIEDDRSVTPTPTGQFASTEGSLRSE